MTEQQSFLASIYERPDDSLVHLAYADWLDDNGASDNAAVLRQAVMTNGVPSPPYEDLTYTLYENEYLLLHQRVLFKIVDMLSVNSNYNALHSPDFSKCHHLFRYHLHDITPLNARPENGATIRFPTTVPSPQWVDIPKPMTATYEISGHIINNGSLHRVSCQYTTMIPLYNAVRNSWLTLYNENIMHIRMMLHGYKYNLVFIYEGEPTPDNTNEPQWHRQTRSNYRYD